MDYQRIVIDTIKQSFSDYVSTGEVDSKPLVYVTTLLDKEIDRRVVEKEPTDDIECLKEDINWIRYDLFDHE